MAEADYGNGFARINLFLEGQIRQWRHPDKNGLITIAGDEDGDIPELTASFLFGGAQIELPDVLDRN